MPQEIKQRPDGMYNHWKFMPVKDVTKYPVWILIGVYPDVPRWGRDYLVN